ncbi:small multidrug resistance protein [Oscillatoriales cyanobacterium LEGE 11467]|uniref:Small multidrug resistance protein n=1 Tax=Zarconia navalis LEGE 11467 TaxID=1828826 RepID=A0A928W134_9CYAN|nr:SMR family transporter [Zarconia navalis]MBE9041938.1 small multidrug resistance protein [Zarconia navalis LEGE 11467]
MFAQLFFALLVLLTVGLNTCAQVFLKWGSSQNFLNWYLVGGILTYGLSTVIYILVLSKFNLSIAYPVVIGLTVIATTIAGTFLLEEKLNSVSWIGVGLMITGICAIAFGKVY